MILNKEADRMVVLLLAHVHDTLYTGNIHPGKAVSV